MWNPQLEEHLKQFSEDDNKEIQEECASDGSSEGNGETNSVTQEVPSLVDTNGLVAPRRTLPHVMVLVLLLLSMLLSGFSLYANGSTSPFGSGFVLDFIESAQDGLDARFLLLLLPLVHFCLVYAHWSLLDKTKSYTPSKKETVYCKESHKLSSEAEGNSEITACRGKISALLGEMGAPPLEPPPTALYFETNKLNHISHEQGILLHECLENYVGFFQVLSLALEDLQTATRMHLGLGWKEHGPSYSSAGKATKKSPWRMNSVDRAERAFVGRLLRQQQKQQAQEQLASEAEPSKNRSRRHMPACGGVPLNLLRRRLYHILLQHHTMLTFILDENTEEGERNMTQDHPVITLTLLRCKTDEVINLLSRVMSLYLTFHLETEDHAMSHTTQKWKVMEKLTLAATESRLYMESCLGNRPINTDHGEHGETSASSSETTACDRVLAVRSIIEHVDGLGVAARSMEEELHEMSMASAQDSPDSSTMKGWWERIRTMVQQLESMLETIEEDIFCFQVKSDRREGIGSGEHVDRMSQSRRVEESGDYSVALTNEEFQSTHTRPLSGERDRDASKTLVFLVGSAHQTGKDDDEDLEPQRKVYGMDDDELLLLELKNRLCALPRAEEITVVMGQTQDQRAATMEGSTSADTNENKGEESVKNKVKSDDDVCAVVTMPLNNPHAGLFQGELAESLSTMSRNFTNEDGHKMNEDDVFSAASG